MRMRNLSFCLAMTIVGLFSLSASGQEEPAPQSCKAVHADLVEARSTVGCKPADTFCFLGEVDGNHGLRGTTYFKGDDRGEGPPTSPGFVPYAGNFEYITQYGTLRMRETGLSNPPTSGTPDAGVVNAYQRIVEGTGEFSGATGYLFVSGFNRNQRIVTRVTGEICLPAPVQ